MTSWHQTNLREVCNFVSFIIAAEAFSNFTYKSLFFLLLEAMNLFFHWLSTIKKKERQKNLRFALSKNRCTTNENYCFSAFFFSENLSTHKLKKIGNSKKMFFSLVYSLCSEQYNFLPYLDIYILKSQVGSLGSYYRREICHHTRKEFRESLSPFFFFFQSKLGGGNF